MTYGKPQIAVLGDAASVIENLQKDGTSVTDSYTDSTGMIGNVTQPPPAYDLDE